MVDNFDRDALLEEFKKEGIEIVEIPKAIDPTLTLEQRVALLEAKATFVDITQREMAKLFLAIFKALGYTVQPEGKKGLDN
jgi:hypothetical protein